ncbi:AmmeMemoRadiSam system protein B [Candidatus Woesearchaeota archaeon]|nr:AmmeMemoRadiSam system protein B [Candidatus Woesearchaeota archaeon]
MVRKTAVAGQFYEEDFDALNKQIEECFYSERGPGDLPVKRDEKSRIKAVIVPHAGYGFSGACAAWAYKEIAEAKFPKAFLLLGPNHFGTGSGMSIEDWKMPFGLVKSEKDLIRGIKENTSLGIAEHNHITEHSLEVQLPLLQFSNRDRMADIRIIPAVISRDIDFLELGKELYDYLKGKDITIIISSDFTHYGPNYSFMPFTTDIPERLTKLDKQAIDLISNYDVSGFKDFVNKTQITICGYMPILVFLAMMQHYEEKPKPHLLMHYTSGDVIGDYRNSVSYVSMVFK